MTNQEFNDWRREHLALLPPQAEESIPPLLFVTIEHIGQEAQNGAPWERGFQDDDTLAGEITYVTDWPKTPGGRWTEQGTYYE